MLTAVGFSRMGANRQSNEDFFCVDLSHGLLAVADGVGGSSAGEVASKTAIEAIQDHVSNELENNRDSPADLISEAVMIANRAILRKADAIQTYRGMGTTLTACLVGNFGASFAHVGDSRAYLMRSGKLSLITQDHTTAVLRQLRGKSHEPTYGLKTRLLAALGTSEWVGFDAFSVSLEEDDLLLLCTDGLTAALDQERLGEILRSCADIAGIRAEIDEHSSKGLDDVTFVVARTGLHT